MLRLQYNFKGQKRFIPTEIFLLDRELKNGKVVKNIRAAKYNAMLDKLENALIDAVTEIALNLQSYSVKEIHEYLMYVRLNMSVKEKDADYFSFVENHINENKGIKSPSTLGNMKSTLEVLRRYIKNANTLPFSFIDEKFMNGFMVFIDQAGYSQNSKKNIASHIKQMMKRAKKDNVISENRIEDFALPKSSVSYRNIKAEDFALLVSKRKNFNGRLRFSIDMLLIMFNMQGIELIDLYHLKKENRDRDIIRYRRRKTGKDIFIYVTDTLAGLLDEYSSHPEKLVSNNYTQGSFRDALQKNLHKISEELGFEKHLTSKWAKHTYATLGRQAGVERDILQKLLGHNQKDVTDYYLEYSHEKIKEAALKIEKFVNDEVKKYSQALETSEPA